MGVKATIGDYEVSCMEERLSKASRTFGLGIHYNGLTVFTCSIIFWSVVVPITLFGSEPFFVQ